jgi:hypothetical protein
VGADIEFSGADQIGRRRTRPVTIALTATHNGKKIFGRAVAVAKLA